MTNNTTYIIRTKSNAGIPVEYNASGPNRIRRGETATFTFDFDDFNEDLVVEDTYTVGANQSEIYNTITVNSGATLIVDGVLRGDSLDNQGNITVNGELIVSDGTTNTLEDFISWAGSYSTQEDLVGVNRYRDNIPTGENIDSIAIGIEPNDELENKNIIGVWGVIDSIEDNRPKAITTNQYQFSIYVLSKFGDYTGHSDMESDLRI